MALTSLELCAGAGGQALGLEMAGFTHSGLFENDKHACQTLRMNRPKWQVFEHDLFEEFDFSPFQNVDLLAGGLPCPPFSKAGKQLGERDERNLFSRGVEIAEIVRPRAIMFENVRGMLDSAFDDYRARITEKLENADYRVFWKLLNASDYGVPQLRPRVVMVAIQNYRKAEFPWPISRKEKTTVAEALYDLVASNGWKGADAWRMGAKRISPTIVGGSKKHGGPDLGPTRARKAWADYGVDGRSIAEHPPESGHEGNIRLTVRMVARLQGFPDQWEFAGKKTNAYRQVGNAFPPPVASAVGSAIYNELLVQTASREAA